VVRRQTMARVRHALSWVLVVIVTATVTTLVVGRVGEDVAGELTTAPPLQASRTTSTPPAGRSTSSSPTPPAAPTSTPSPEGAESEPAPRPAARTPRATASPRPSPRADDGGPEGSSTASGPRTTSSPSAGTTRTFSTGGGAVVAGCRGGRPYAKSVTPRYGYAFKTETDEHELTVKFTGSGNEYTLHIGCRSGTPVLVESDSHEE
jgi:hypothetical protein